MDLQIPIDNFMSDDLKAAINYLNQNNVVSSSSSIDDIELDTPTTSVEDDKGEIAGQDANIPEINFGDSNLTFEE